MEWWLVLLVIFCALCLLMATRLPIAFCFIAINIVGAYFLWGGLGGIDQFVLSIFTSVTNFNLAPVPLFIVMGDVLIHSGIAIKAIDVVDMWMGKVPGRLGLVTIAASVGWSACSVLWPNRRIPGDVPRWRDCRGRRSARDRPARGDGCRGTSSAGSSRPGSAHATDEKPARSRCSRSCSCRR